jgi:hypothetical protein
MNRDKIIAKLEVFCESKRDCSDCPLRDLNGDIGCYWDNASDDVLKAFASAAGINLEDEEDPVNRPSHYTSGGIECIDALEASMTPIEYAGFLKGQVFKYIWRYRLKGKPSEDLKKARYYLDRLIQITEKEATV